MIACHTDSQRLYYLLVRQEVNTSMCAVSNSIYNVIQTGHHLSAIRIRLSMCPAMRKFNFTVSCKPLSTLNSRYCNTVLILFCPGQLSLAEQPFHPCHNGRKSDHDLICSFCDAYTFINKVAHLIQIQGAWITRAEFINAIVFHCIPSFLYHLYSECSRVTFYISAVTEFLCFSQVSRHVDDSVIFFCHCQQKSVIGFVWTKLGHKGFPLASKVHKAHHTMF